MTANPGHRPTTDPRPLRYGATLPIASIDPLTGAWNEASSLVFSRPINVDAYGTLRGELVTRWELSEDRRTCRLHVRNDVSWHDGARFCADDLAFTLGLLADPELAGRVKPALGDVASIGVEGDIVELSFDRPVVGLAATLARACVVPAHIFDRAAVLAGAVNDHPIGTGPYRVVERADGTATFAYHPDHPHAAEVAGERGTRPIGTIEMCHIAADADRAAVVAAGAVHFAQVKPQHLGELTGSPDVVVHTIETRVWRALTFGLGRPHLGDPRVRRALSTVIDRQRVVAAALGGYGNPQYWPVPPSSWASPPDPPQLGREHAEALLREVGWDRGPDGRWLVDGQPVELTFCYLETETFRAAASVELAQQFGEFGIAVDLEPITWTQYHEMDRVGLRGSAFDGIVVGWSGGVDPYDNLASRYSTTGAYNRDGYSDAELDALLEQAGSAADEAVARTAYRAALEITHRDSIMAPLANPQYVFAATADLAGLDGFEVDSFYELTQYAYLFHRPA